MREGEGRSEGGRIDPAVNVERFMIIMMDT